MVWPFPSTIINKRKLGLGYLLQLAGLERAHDSVRVLDGNGCADPNHSDRNCARIVANQITLSKFVLHANNLLKQKAPVATRSPLGNLRSLGRKHVCLKSELRSDHLVVPRR